MVHSGVINNKLIDQEMNENLVFTWVVFTEII